MMKKQEIVELIAKETTQTTTMPIYNM